MVVSHTVQGLPTGLHGTFNDGDGALELWKDDVLVLGPSDAPTPRQLPIHRPPDEYRRQQSRDEIQLFSGRAGSPASGSERRSNQCVHSAHLRRRELHRTWP